MTTNGLQPLADNEFSGLVTKQKDRKSKLLDIPAGECTIKTTGSGQNKKVVRLKDTYIDHKGQTQVYPVYDVNGQICPLSSLSGKAPIVTEDGTLVPRPGICDAGSDYSEIEAAVKANDFKFTLSFVTGRVNGFYGRYAVVTK